MEPSQSTPRGFLSTLFVSTTLLGIACLVGCKSKPAIRYALQSDYGISDPQFARTMGNLLGPPLIGGNSIQSLKNGDEIFPAMLEAIRSARKTITFETYVYWSGDIGERFADAFSERALAGVNVCIIIDSI